MSRRTESQMRALDWARTQRYTSVAANHARDCAGAYDALMEEHKRILALLDKGLEVVDDFLPNLGRCAIQDFGRLNDFCIEARKVRLDQGGG